jgi:hypothetical protein
MKRKFVVGAMALALTASGAGAAVAAKKNGPPPKRATVNAVTSFKVKINRYIQARTRWQKDTYFVRSGGTLHVVNNAPQEGPHTFSVVKKSDLPRTANQVFNCQEGICGKIAAQFGVDPNSNDEGPPPHLFVDNGTAQDTPPAVNQPGDSAFIGPNKGDSVDLKVTAPKGTTLYFLCAIHAQMQAKVIVG